VEVINSLFFFICKRFLFKIIKNISIIV